jgi:hypothetical protein
MRRLVLHRIAFLVVTVCVGLGYTALQPRMRAGDGKGWNGQHYSRMYEDFKAGTRSQIHTPFSRRVGLPFLASRLGVPEPQAFLLVNLASGVVACVFVFLTLSRVFPLHVAWAWSLPMCFFLFSPIRFPTYYPFIGDPPAMATLAVGTFLLTCRLEVLAGLVIAAGIPFRESHLYLLVAMLGYPLVRSLSRRDLARGARSRWRRSSARASRRGGGARRRSRSAHHEPQPLDVDGWASGSTRAAAAPEARARPPANAARAAPAPHAGDHAAAAESDAPAGADHAVQAASSTARTAGVSRWCISTALQAPLHTAPTTGAAEPSAARRPRRGSASPSSFSAAVPTVVAACRATDLTVACTPARAIARPASLTQATPRIEDSSPAARARSREVARASTSASTPASIVDAAMPSSAELGSEATAPTAAAAQVAFHRTSPARACGVGTARATPLLDVQREPLGAQTRERRDVRRDPRRG